MKLPNAGDYDEKHIIIIGKPAMNMRPTLSADQQINIDSTHTEDSLVCVRNLFLGSCTLLID